MFWGLGGPVFIFVLSVSCSGCQVERTYIYGTCDRFPVSYLCLQHLQHIADVFLLSNVVLISIHQNQ